MQQCNETITVLNRRINPDTRLDEWTPTVIRGVSWHSKIVANVTQAGLKAADTATVRIPVDADTGGRSYLTPQAYKAAESTPEAYTLARGDILVRAEITESMTPAQAQAAYEDVVTIISVTDNTRRPRAPHRKVVGA